GTLLPRKTVPVLPCLGGRRDRTIHLGRSALVHLREHVVLVVWHDRLEGVAGSSLLAADDACDVEAVGFHLLQPPGELDPLRRSGRVIANRLVLGARRAEDPGSAHCRDSTIRAVPERVTYAVQGWGVGELFFSDDVLV